MAVLCIIKSSDDSVNLSLLLSVTTCSLTEAKPPFAPVFFLVAVVVIIDSLTKAVSPAVFGCIFYFFLLFWYH